jgi:hypothetical protein
LGRIPVNLGARCRSLFLFIVVEKRLNSILEASPQLSVIASEAKQSPRIIVS